MSCKEFFDDYVLLKPEQATLLDIFSFLLFSGSETKVVERSEHAEEHKHEDSKTRWYIFISLLLQKFFLTTANQLHHLGEWVEDYLNFISINGGFFTLFVNRLRGKNVLRAPERLSEKYISIIGNLDTRIELDKNIRLGDGELRYYGMLSVMASKLSYENAAFVRSVLDDHWKMKFLGLYNFWNDFQDKPSTQAIMFQDIAEDPNLIVVSFRGTNPFDAFALQTDVDLSYYELKHVGRIHSGFMKALGLQKSNGWPKEIAEDSNKEYAYYAVRKMLREILEKNEKAKFIVTGHSLGAALAILFVAVLALHDDEWLLDRLEGVYNFGQPRVGDIKFGKFMEEKMKKYNVNYRRYIYCYDIVPRIPFDHDAPGSYKHFGKCLFFNSLYKEMDEWEEPDKNYFSPWWVIPKILNAVWELIRSYVMPVWKGREYREGWCLKVYRVVGLVIPGLPAHGPQDYVNCTRLGLD